MGQRADGIFTARRKTLPPDGLLCNYSLHLCHGQRLKGFEYCIKHILEDKSAPYRPCAYTVETTHSSHSCPRPAPRSSRGEGYCREHSRAVVSATRRVIRKRGGGAIQALHESVVHTKNKMSRGETETRLGQIALTGDKLEESDDDNIKVADTWAGDDGDSDCESVDSEAEESLKHAGVFTGEEVMRTMRDKLIRLQKLYIEQFGRLGHLLRESKRTYLAQIKEEKEAGLMNMASQPGDQLSFIKLKAMTHYHSPSGREALLASKLREKRGNACTSGNKVHVSHVSGPVRGPCQHYLTSTTKCGEPVVPMTKYCPKHILEQQGQVLFRPCGAITDKEDGPCQVPVPAMFSHTHCVFHIKLQPTICKSEVKTKLNVNERESEIVLNTEVDADAANNCDTDTDREEKDDLKTEDRDEIDEVKQEVPSEKENIELDVDA